MATVWVIRGGNRHRLVHTFLTDNEVGVGYPMLGDGRDLDHRAVERRLTDEGTPRAEAEAKMFLSFVRRMTVGDIVAMPDPQAGGLACGVVAGDYRYRDDLDESRARHRRPVEWRRRLPFDALPERLANLPHQRQPIQDAADGRLRDLALQCCRLEMGDDPLDRPRTPLPTASSRPRRPRAAPRPPKATIAEKRCGMCFVVKPADVFEDGADWCRDCA